MKFKKKSNIIDFSKSNEETIEMEEQPMEIISDVLPKQETTKAPEVEPAKKETAPSDKPKRKFFYNPVTGAKIDFIENIDFLENFPHIKVIVE